MTTPLSRTEEKVKRALQLFNDLREQYPEKDINSLLQKAVVQYDLSPKESEALFHNFKSTK